jgi:hypothetical protein
LNPPNIFRFIFQYLDFYFLAGGSKNRAANVQPFSKPPNVFEIIFANIFRALFVRGSAQRTGPQKYNSF